MKIIKASYEILTPISENGKTELQFIEKIGRVCYKSEDRITDSSAETFVKMLIDRGHEAMIEHSILTVKFICDRATSHELVRHRLCSFAQESQRYCNYSGDKFDNEVTFIEPSYIDSNLSLECWKNSMYKAELDYLGAIKNWGLTPEEARAVLPNSTKTEIVITANYREWRNILKLRTSKAAAPQMRELMIPLLKELQGKIPVIFDDIEGAE